MPSNAPKALSPEMTGRTATHEEVTTPGICALPALLSRVPLVATRPDLGTQLDHRAGFLLSLMDGETDVGTVLDLSGMPRDETLVLLDNLIKHGLVFLR
jgi:hypothetical protein